jgi:LmbE family N-acetylglucosaminyl deacetylase
LYTGSVSVIMQTTYDAIYFAPHLDAHVYQRAAAGERILIVTVMAGSPPVQQAGGSAYIDSLHERWELAGDAAAERRAEDIAACTILRAEHLHFTVPDCIYRGDPASGAPFYTSDDDIFGDIHPAEGGLVGEIAASLRALPPAGQVVAPLGVGHHVDHLLVRAAAEEAWPAGLWYYEDYPYVEKSGYLRRVLGDDLRAWRPDVQEITPEGLTAKYDAIWAYRSQMSTFFKSREEMEAQVGAYIERTGGERLWLRI